jgi:hypothetical protein
MNKLHILTNTLRIPYNIIATTKSKEEISLTDLTVLRYR